MSDFIDLSGYENIFMSEIDSHGDRRSIRNAGIVKINKKDISIAYVGIGDVEDRDEICGGWITVTHCYDLNFKMRDGVIVYIPRENLSVKDPSYSEKQNLIKIQLEKELNELLGVSDAG